MKKKLGKMEAQLLAYCQMRNLRFVRTGELTGPLQITAKQERELFSRMARAGIIAQVRRGLYLVPSRLPLGGRWSPNEILALDTLIQDRQGKYQICGPNAFNRYGFQEQIPTRVYAYNNRLSGDRTIGAVELTLIKVADERLGSTEEVQTPAGLKAVYSSRVRALVDAVYDWSRFDSLPRGYDWIRQEMTAGRVKASELVRVAVCYGNQGTLRRIGALLDREGAGNRLLREIERALNSSKSVIALVPGRPRRGTVSKRWGVIFNEQH